MWPDIGRPQNQKLYIIMLYKTMVIYSIINYLLFFKYSMLSLFSTFKTLKNDISYKPIKIWYLWYNIVA